MAFKDLPMFSSLMQYSKLQWTIGTHRDQKALCLFCTVTASVSTFLVRKTSFRARGLPIESLAVLFYHCVLLCPTKFGRSGGTVLVIELRNSGT
jgi:hypothetical protein